MNVFETSEKSQIEQLRLKFKEWLQLAKDYFLKMTQREKYIVVAAAVLGISWLSYSIYEPVYEAFAAQSEELKEANKQLELATIALARYEKLKSRREAIESAYKEVEIKEGGLSYLEELVRSRAGIAQGLFTISERATRQFGSDYEQSSYSVRFSMSDLPRLVDFLKELAHGKKPLILSSLSIRRRPSGDSLDIDLDVSSIRRNHTENPEQ